MAYDHVPWVIGSSLMMIIHPVIRIVRPEMEIHLNVPFVHPEMSICSIMYVHLKMPDVP